MVSALFMCLRYKSENSYTRDLPIFFTTYKQALMYAHKNAYIKSRNGVQFVFYKVKIFKIPFRSHVCLNETDDAFYENLIETIYDPKTTKVMLIQKRWRTIYQKRVDAANIIKEAVREAIANPGTQLCINRLLHEFNEM